MEMYGLSNPSCRVLETDWDHSPTAAQRIGARKCVEVAQLCTVRQVQLWCCCALQGSGCLRCPPPVRMCTAHLPCARAHSPSTPVSVNSHAGPGRIRRFPRCPGSTDVLLKHYAKCSLASYCIALPWATAGPRLEPPVEPI
jgi:hypothetical protein